MCYPAAMTAALRTKSIDSSLASALRTIEAERDGLDTLRRALANGMGEPFSRAVAIAAGAKGRVIVTGMGKSGHVGRKIAATLASTGTPAYFVHPGEASHGDLGMIQPDDVIVALSWSGETQELSDIVSYAKRFRVPLIALTAHADSTLGQEADVCLAIPKAREACPNGLAPTTSTTMQMALGDALAVALLETRSFTKLDFQTFHPGGKLGAHLKQVRSAMHSGDRLPLVPRGTTMADAIVVLSQKGFGCVIVAEPSGRLAGIVTDGDIRRHMAPDLLSKSVDDVMTLKPIVIDPGMLLGEALEIIETRKRSALVVVEADRPVGLVTVLDLLRIGVV